MAAALEDGEWSAARPGRTLPPGKERIPISQQAVWAPGPVWTEEKSHPHMDSIPDRPARNSYYYYYYYYYCMVKKSLYRAVYALGVPGG
jgi:hypothetical protein